MDPVQPEDIAVLIALAPRRAWADSEARLREVMAPDTYLASLGRLQKARLCLPATQQVSRKALGNLLIHGVPYLFPGRLGEMVRGTPTAWTNLRIRRELGLGPVDQEQEVVWTSHEANPPVNQVLGRALEPLAPWVPELARLDPAFDLLMGLVECLRVGRARERAWASQQLAKLGEAAA